MNMHRFRITLLLLLGSTLTPLAGTQAGDTKSSADDHDYPYIGVDEATTRKVRALKRAEAVRRFEKAVAEAKRIADANAAESARRLKRKRRAEAAKRINRSAAKKKSTARLDRNALEILRLKKLIEEAEAAKKAARKNSGTTNSENKTTTRKPATEKTTDAGDDAYDPPYIGVTPEVAKRVAALKQQEARKKAAAKAERRTGHEVEKKKQPPSDKRTEYDDYADPPYIGVTEEIAKKVAAMKKQEARERAEALKRIETALAAAKKISDANQRESRERLQRRRQQSRPLADKDKTDKSKTGENGTPADRTADTAQPPEKTAVQAALLTQKSDEEIRKSLERDFWRARFGRHPLDKSRFVCFVESKPVVFFDGESNTRLKLVATKDDLYAITDSNIDSSYTDTGISVDRSEKIKFDRVRKKTSVIFKNYTKQYIENLSKGYYATVTLGFWPSWPKTRPLSVNVSLLGFNKAYNQLANCKSM